VSLQTVCDSCGKRIEPARPVTTLALTLSTRYADPLAAMGREFGPVERHYCIDCTHSMAALQNPSQIFTLLHATRSDA
jgi:hypothetical protein